MTQVLLVLLCLVGVLLITLAVDSAVRTFVVPRGVVSTLTRIVFRATRLLFNLVARPTRTYEARDRVMAVYAPVSLLVLPVTWLLVIFGGFGLVFLSLGHSWAEAFRLSGSSLLTLGFDRPEGFLAVAASFAEATLGLAMVALLIAYLPTMYAAFSKREVTVTALAVRAGTPPSVAVLLARAQAAGFLHELDNLFEMWETWFVELEESHTSLSALSFFRSPNPHRSWVTAAGCVLDTAAFRHAALDLPASPHAGLCIRSGFLALREIANVFGQPFDADPGPQDPISIARAEFNEVFDALLAAGLPMVEDRDAAWRSFAGWRVNYDAVLLQLAALIMAPYAPWVSDRSLPRR